MKIDRIETFTKGHLCVVRVTADNGAQGYGQVAPYNADISEIVLRRQVCPHFLGEDPRDMDSLGERCVEREYKFPGSYVCRALAGVETALWDLVGKADGKGVCEMIGGKHKPIVVYGSSMSREIKPEDEGARLAELKRTKGYTAFKVRVGKVCGHDEDQWPGRTEALIREVRKAVGGDTRLLADGNSCYTPPKAIAVGRMLEGADFCHFEEPCPYWELEWTAEVANALTIPVAGGEQDTDIAQFKRMIMMDSVDVVQPDICYLGGLSRSLRVAEAAAKAGKPCVPHAANRSLVTVFTLHMLAAIRNAGPYLEFSIEKESWTDGLFSPALEVKDGKVDVPAGPGWGVTMNPDWLSSAAYWTSGGK